MLTDSLHKPGFKLQAMILAHLFLAVESNAITAPLWPQARAMRSLRPVAAASCPGAATQPQPWRAHHSFGGPRG